MLVNDISLIAEIISKEERPLTRSKLGRCGENASPRGRASCDEIYVAWCPFVSGASVQIIAGVAAQSESFFERRLPPFAAVCRTDLAVRLWPVPGGHVYLLGADCRPG